jgi:hypothetical protein
MPVLIVIFKQFTCRIKIIIKAKNMKRNQLLPLLFISFFFATCSSTKQPTGVWVNKEKAKGKSFKNIFIIVLTADIQARVKLEGDLVNAATARGYKAVKSIDAMPVDIKNPTTPSKEEVVNKVKASGCDAVFIAALLKEEEAVDYVPSSTSYKIMPYTSYYGYYVNVYAAVSTSSYYSVDKTYFMQSNLYDVASEELMMSVQSEVFRPSSLNSFSTSYTSTLMKQLEKAKIIKKPKN